jgi:membrane associated rhomboid family serine protease
VWCLEEKRQQKGNHRLRDHHQTMNYVTRSLPSGAGGAGRHARALVFAASISAAAVALPRSTAVQERLQKRRHRKIKEAALGLSKTRSLSAVLRRAGVAGPREAGAIYGGGEGGVFQPRGNVPVALQRRRRKKSGGRSDMHDDDDEEEERRILLEQEKKRAKSGPLARIRDTTAADINPAARLYRRAANVSWASVALARQWWHVQVTPGDRVLYLITAANTAVFLAWQIAGARLGGVAGLSAVARFLQPALHRVLPRHFISGAAHSSPGLSLLGSCFSHRGALHFLFNMVALNSFGSAVSTMFGADHLLAMYVGGGVLSGYASYMFHTLRRAPLAGSLGASGSVFALAAAFVVLNPHANLNFIFLPGVPFEARTLATAVVAYDVAGAVANLFGRRLFFPLDHMAHLAGAGVGVAWATERVRAMAAARARRRGW